MVASQYIPVQRKLGNAFGFWCRSSVVFVWIINPWSHPFSLTASYLRLAFCVSVLYHIINPGLFGRSLSFESVSQLMISAWWWCRWTFCEHGLYAKKCVPHCHGSGTWDIFRSCHGKLSRWRTERTSFILIILVLLSASSTILPLNVTVPWRRTELFLVPFHFTLSV